MTITQWSLVIYDDRSSKWEMLQMPLQYKRPTLHIVYPQNPESKKIP